MQPTLKVFGEQVRSGSFLPNILREHIRSLLYDRNVSEMPDRRYFEQSIIPFLAHAAARNVLFVGCRAYTSHYPRLFEEHGMDLFTCDINPFSERYGSPGRHRTLDACALSPQDFPVTLDAVVFSGVIGFGVNTLP